MLSILIPTYNFNSVDLVRSLQQQAEVAEIEYEIIVADDASTCFITENFAINNLKNARFIQLKKNIGRANIRNFLADEAKFKYLLFIDGDAQVYQDKFIENYIQLCKPNCCIVGGVAYQKNINKEFSLRAKYGQKREEKKHYFSAFNLLIDKQLFLQIKFDKKLYHYGYEDFLFGMEVEKISPIKYINNKLIHKGLDKNIVFLNKTEKAIENLWYLYSSHPEIHEKSQLLHTFFILKKWNLSSLVAIIFCFLKSAITANLISKKPSLTLFSFYKIGLLCNIKKEH